MQNSLFVKSEIVINATAEKVWDVLTNPAQTKKYMFGCETVSDWKAGSELLWRGEWEGNAIVFVKGTIKAIESNKKLVYTTIDPNNTTIADVPENYLTVTYLLEPQGNSTLLIVTQGDYNKVADGERRYQEAYNNGEGWNPILVQMKQIAETE
jgi:uncharacterized protein YndB with AHSA1/START domain